MKSYIIVILALLLLVAITACAVPQEDEAADEVPADVIVIGDDEAAGETEANLAHDAGSEVCGDYCYDRVESPLPEECLLNHECQGCLREFDCEGARAE